MRTTLLVTISICAAALASGGCARPWTEQFASPTGVTAVANADATTAGLTPQENANHLLGTASSASGHPTSATPEMAGVLDQLQQIRAIDPTAEAKLMEQLRQTPADSWPLVAEQFRASLAYREQLVSNSGRLAIADHPKSGPLAPSNVAKRETAAVPDQATVNGTPDSAQTQSAGARVMPLGSSHASTAADTSPYQDPPTEIPDRAPHDVMQAALSTPTQPVASRPADEWRELVARAAEDLTDRVPSSPTTTAEVHQHVSLRMLRLLSGNTDGALEPIPAISPTEQDYWSRQVFALATYLDHHGQPDDKRRAAASVLHLDEAVSHLRELGSLSVRNLSFCKSVYGYGAIEPYDAALFSPGEQVSLYVEVENYHSRSTEKGFCTLLGSTYELLDDKGERVGGGEIPDVNDCCRSRRRDFHIQYSLTLPETLTPGRYQLQLVIKDRQSDKRGQATVAFEIKGAASSAVSLSTQ
ncbi:MAG TPA: hypothetical protein VGK58_19810 [Lacipirellulaceae bacterium]